MPSKSSEPRGRHNKHCGIYNIPKNRPCIFFITAFSKRQQLHFNIKYGLSKTLHSKFLEVTPNSRYAYLRASRATLQVVTYVVNYYELRGVPGVPPSNGVLLSNGVIIDSLRSPRVAHSTSVPKTYQ
jgi:hypothetical protein